MTAFMTSPVGRDGVWWLQPLAVSSRVSTEGTSRQAFSLPLRGWELLSFLFCPLQLQEVKEPTRGLTQQTRSCPGQRQSGNVGIWAGLGCRWGRTSVCWENKLGLPFLYLLPVSQHRGGADLSTIHCDNFLPVHHMLPCVKPSLHSISSPLAVFLPGESQGWGSLVGCRLWGCTESDRAEVT